MSYDAAQEQLQNTLVTTFLANMAFLNEYDNSLFLRVEGLSQAINSELYTENYELEFLQEEGDFDIFDKKNNRYLYNKKPSNFNRKAVAKTDFTSKGSVSVLDDDFFQGKSYDLFDDIEYFCNFEYSHKKLANDTLKYSLVLENNIGDFKYKKFKTINKFIFIGTLLGRHIPLISEKIKAQNFFICEPNLEIFRLSLFVIDYSVFARGKNTVIFSIMDDEHEFSVNFEKFMTHKSFENYCIKYFTTDYGIESYYNNIMTSVLSHKSSMFNHHMMLENVWKNVSERINKYKTIQVLQKSDNDILEKPILLLGAGPSLTDNINWVEKNKDKFIIVAIAATYKILARYGIKPDIVTTLDPQYSVLNKKHFDLQHIDKISNCHILAAINTDKRILDRFSQDKLFLYEMYKPLHKQNICYRGYSVGEMSATILLALGFKNMYLLGIDLAVNQKTGSSHMGGYFSEEYDNLKEKKHKESSETFTLKEELVTVKGNLCDEVYTNRLFALSLNAMSSNFSMIKKEDQTIFNLSNHGSYIQSTTPMIVDKADVNNLVILNKNNLKEEIDDYLLEVSKDKLEEIDMLDLKKELEYLKTINREFLDFKLIPSKNFMDFRVKLDSIIDKVFYPDVYCSYLFVVFKHFINIHIQYILYCFNNTKIKRENEKLKKIEEYFLEDTITLLNKYISYLEKI